MKMYLVFTVTFSRSGKSSVGLTTALRERANLGSIVKTSLAEGTTVRHEKQGTHRTSRKAERNRARELATLRRVADGNMCLN